ncbi:MAG: hypothetical protein FWC36_00905 [Spirochaetes bacterium]|nr:hypothetical protein [Spirochaetota bacterium]
MVPIPPTGSPPFNFEMGGDSMLLNALGNTYTRLSYEQTPDNADAIGDSNDRQ